MAAGQRRLRGFCPYNPPELGKILEFNMAAAKKKPWWKNVKVKPFTLGHEKAREQVKTREVVGPYAVHLSLLDKDTRAAVSRRGQVVHRCRDIRAGVLWAHTRIAEINNGMGAASAPSAQNVVAISSGSRRQTSTALKNCCPSSTNAQRNMVSSFSLCP